MFISFLWPFFDFLSFVWERRKFFFLCRKRWYFENLLLYNFCVKTGKVKKRPIKFNFIFFFFIFILFDLEKKFITFHQNLVSMDPFVNNMKNNRKIKEFFYFFSPPPKEDFLFFFKIFSMEKTRKQKNVVLLSIYFLTSCKNTLFLLPFSILLSYGSYISSIFFLIKLYKWRDMRPFSPSLIFSYFYPKHSLHSCINSLYHCKINVLQSSLKKARLVEFFSPCFEIIFLMFEL